MLEGSAPAKHAFQVVRQLIFHPSIDPFMGQWRGGDEVVTALAQRLSQVQQRAVLGSFRGHVRSLANSPQLNNPVKMRVASNPAAL